MNEETAPDQAALTPSGNPEPAPQKPEVLTAAALRDLIWRVEHVRSLLEGATSEADPHELSALLDTSDARAALELNGAGAIQGGANDDRNMEGGTSDRQGHQVQR